MTERFKPGRVQRSMVKIGGRISLGTVQAALVMGVQLATEDGLHPPWKYARRTLAAWLDVSEWQRITFKLYRQNDWREYAQQLMRLGVAVPVRVTLDSGMEIIGAELTPLGKAIAEALRAEFVEPLTGMEYASFIDDRRNERRAYA